MFVFVCLLAWLIGYDWMPSRLFDVSFFFFFLFLFLFLLLLLLLLSSSCYCGGGDGSPRNGRWAPKGAASIQPDAFVSRLGDSQGPQGLGVEAPSQ